MRPVELPYLERLVALGTTSLGTEVKINRTFHQADVKLVVCDTEYHQFCGYGGGAGDVFDAFAAGSRVVDEMYRVTVKERVDTVIISAGRGPARSCSTSG